MEKIKECLDIKQVWFFVMHSKVGDSYDDRGLSDHALKWKIDESVQFGTGFDDHAINALAPDHKGRLYVGESQLDSRRPLVIIDYAETAQIWGYIEKIDRLGGKDDLMIRDEIRLARPGFNLGRAQFGSLFGLNFTLFIGDVAQRETSGRDTGNRNFRSSRHLIWPFR